MGHLGGRARQTMGEGDPAPRAWSVRLVGPSQPGLQPREEYDEVHVYWEPQCTGWTGRGSDRAEAGTPIGEVPQRPWGMALGAQPYIQPNGQLKPQLCHLIAVCPWAADLTSLSLSVLFCKTGMMLVSVSQAFL